MEIEETFSSQARQRAASSAAQKRIAAALSQTSQSVRILVYLFAFRLLLLSSLRRHSFTERKKLDRNFQTGFQRFEKWLFIQIQPERKRYRCSDLNERGSNWKERILLKTEAQTEKRDSFCFKVSRETARKKLRRTQQHNADSLQYVNSRTR